MLLSLLMLFIVVGFPMTAGPVNRIAKWPGSEPEKVDQNDESEKNDTKIIDVNVSLNESEFAALQRLSIDFTMKHPEIKAELVNLPAARTYEHLKQSALLGEAPDIMLLNNSWVTEFAASGFLKNVDSMFAGETFSDVPAGLLQPLKWNGYLWGVPKDADPLVTVWSAMLIKEAGGSSLPRNWGEFESLVQAIGAIDSRRAALPQWAAFNPDSLEQLLIWASSFQGPDGDPVNMTSFPKKQRELVHGLDAMRSKGMLMESTDSTRLLDSLLKGNLLSAVLPLSQLYSNWPAYAGKLIVQNQNPDQPLWLNGRSFALSAKTKWPDEAKAWVEYVTDPQKQQIAFKGFGKLPARKSVYGVNGLDPISPTLHKRLGLLSKVRMDAAWQQQYSQNGQLWSRWLNGEVNADELLGEWQ